MVEEELVGVRPDLDDFRFVLALIVDPGVDQLLAKDIALQEEVVIAFESREYLREASRSGLNGVALGAF